MDWKTILSYISGSVDEELLLRSEYLVAELGKRLGKQALDEVASIVNSDTVLGWHRRLVAKKFDSSKNRQYPGRPRVYAAIEELVVRFAKENSRNRSGEYACLQYKRTARSRQCLSTRRAHSLRASPIRECLTKTQPVRSTTGKGLRKPRKDNGLAPQLGELVGLSVGALELEVRCLVANP